MLRSMGSMVYTVYLIATGQFVVLIERWSLWELWFYLGAVLFGMSTWRFWRVQIKAPAGA
jgi:fructose-1,6-bisphosphatase/inositol monophosphatase family enzyme